MPQTHRPQPAAVMIVLSILYLRCGAASAYARRAEGAAFNSLFEMRGVNPAASQLWLFLLSILYLRCARLPQEDMERVCRTFNSLFEMPLHGLAEVTGIPTLIRLSILYLRC